MSTPESGPQDDPSSQVDEDAVFYLSADGIRRSAAWRLGDHGADGPLPTDLRRELAERFSFSEEQMLELSRSIGEVLNPERRPYLAEVDTQKARSRGKDKLSKTMKLLSDAGTLVDRAEAELDSIDSRSDQNSFGRDPIQQMRRQLRDIVGALLTISVGLDERLDHPQLVAREHTAIKKIRDQRRIWILDCIFELRERNPGKLGYTTDPGTSKRSGKLFDFVNAIVAAIADPSWDPDWELDWDPEQPAPPAAMLSWNTIFEDFRNFQKSTSDRPQNDI